jgi:hypothetical protein
MVVFPLLDLRRWLRITLRTLHIIAFALVLGGVWFDLPATLLLRPAIASAVTGGLLAISHAGSTPLWFVELRGAITLAKLLLLILAILSPPLRVPLLLLVTGAASVSSHMPGRYRYYSIWHRRRTH